MLNSYKKIKVLIFCCAFLGVTANAENNTTVKLDRVLNQITSVKTDITKKERQQISVKQQLNNLKKKMDVLAATLRETTKNLKQQKSILAKLTREQAGQQLKLKEAQNKLASQINLAYQVEHPSYFKVVLGKNRKVTPNLLLVYHQYVFVTRLGQMRDIKKTLENLEQNRRKIKLQTQGLERLEKKQEQQRLELEKVKKEHNQVLASIKNKIAKQHEKLQQLLLAKRNLEKLVDTLTPHKLSAVSPASKERFCKNFFWPTRGVVITHFGSSIEQSSWKWSGIIISAALHQEVHAIFSGRVVYAARLAGYGLLLIIDHGNGYMSLYGHNSSLHKKLDAKVEAGEVIATVGKSDSEEAELYFAIRYNGKPIDPERWCR